MDGPVSYTGLIKHNHAVRNLWISQVISNVGDWFSSIAVLGLTLQLTQSGFALSLMMLCQMAPAFLTAPLAGVVADRFDRKKIMILADLLRAMLSLGFLLAHTADDVWLIFLSASLLSGCSPFFDAAKNATLPSIATGRALLTANALSSATWGLTLTVGSAVGGLIAAQFGRGVAFELNAMSFVLSAVFVARIMLPVASGAGRPARFFADFVEGMRYIRKDRATRVFLPVKATWGLAGGSAVLLYAVFGGQVFNAGDAGIAILYTARGIGTIIGTIGMKFFSAPQLPRLRWAILVGLLGYGFSFIGVSFASSIWLTALFITLSTCGSMIMWVFSSLGLQLNVAENIRGRVFAAENGLFTLSFAVSTMSAGLLLEAYTPRTVSLWVGLFGMALALVWYYFARRIPLSSR